jgi:hypothetical protein
MLDIQLAEQLNIIRFSGKLAKLSILYLSNIHPVMNKVSRLDGKLSKLHLFCERIPKNFNDTGKNAKLDSMFLILEMNKVSNV